MSPRTPCLNPQDPLLWCFQSKGGIGILAQATTEASELMGITYETAELLKSARSRGVNYETTLQIGRQNLIMGRAEVRRLGLDPATVLKKNWDFAEEFFKALGARTVTSMDASGFEGATILHDLNRAIPESLKNSFSAVMDGGTMEHIFDVARCLRNYMEMTCLGGHVLIHTPANNFLEHGFHQFSTQLFHTVLSPPNGFRLTHLILMEYSPILRCWRPVEAVKRHEATTKWPTAVYVEAQRIGSIPEVFNVQQAEYAEEWSKTERSKNFGDIYPVSRELRWKLLEMFPRACRTAERLYRGVGMRLGKRRGYERV